MPYIVKSMVPQWGWRIRGYPALRPFSAALLGKQVLLVATKPAQQT